MSLHRKRKKPPDSPSKRTNAELLVDGMGPLLGELPDAAETRPASSPRRASPRRVRSSRSPSGQPSAPRLWRASVPTAVAAALTDEEAPDPADELTAGLQKRARDLDLPPWLKGRYGTAVGAPYGTLQTIDLATGDGLDAAVAAQCEAEAIPGRTDQVRQLVSHALGTVRPRRRQRPTLARVYACAPVDGRLLEGYIDLLYATDDGLVVVDYKTAAAGDPAELDRRTDRYRLQGATTAR